MIRPMLYLFAWHHVLPRLCDRYHQMRSRSRRARAGGYPYSIVGTGLTGSDVTRFVRAARRLFALCQKWNGPTSIGRGPGRTEMPLDDIIERSKQSPFRSQRLRRKHALAPYEAILLEVASKGARTVFARRRGLRVFCSVVVVEPGADRQPEHYDNLDAVGKCYETFFVHVPGDRKQGGTMFKHNGRWVAPAMQNWKQGCLFAGDVLHYGAANRAKTARISLMFAAMSPGLEDENRESLVSQCPILVNK